ncbi:hypothetical protein V1498_15690 [Peribacillus sp. SCS-26]|uniref:hypothetical protein n=1 Tax=Paraperibacillus marinus TaxID=3115295 RepID=UPI0039057962
MNIIYLFGIPGVPFFAPPPYLCLFLLLSIPPANQQVFFRYRISATKLLSSLALANQQVFFRYRISATKLLSSLALANQQVFFTGDLPVL